MNHYACRKTEESNRAPNHSRCYVFPNAGLRSLPDNVDLEG